MSPTTSHRTWIGLLASLTALCGASLVGGDEPAESRENLKEPVFRVTKRVEPEERPHAHALDPAIDLARDGLARIQRDVTDYSCTIVKQERINGELTPTEHIYAEIRNRKVQNGVVVQPLSVYLRFLQPEEVKGRQVIYVEGTNNGKMVAQEAKGVASLAGAVWLRPDGVIAMRGQRYPVTDIGIENLIDQLIQRGSRDRKNDPNSALTESRFIKGAKINGRGCTVLEVTHTEQKPWFDFHIARVFIDDELQLPVRYAAYTWPAEANGRPQLEEAYTYLDVKVNVGLTDDDFDYTKKFRQGD